MFSVKYRLCTLIYYTRVRIPYTRTHNQLARLAYEHTFLSMKKRACKFSIFEAVGYLCWKLGYLFKNRKFFSKIFIPKVFYEIVKWVLDKFYLTCVSSLMKSVFSMGFRLWLVESLVIVKPHASLKVWPTIMH